MQKKDTTTKLKKPISNALNSSLHVSKARMRSTIDFSIVYFNIDMYKVDTFESMQCDKRSYGSYKNRYEQQCIPRIKPHLLMYEDKVGASKSIEATKENCKIVEGWWLSQCFGM